MPDASGRPLLSEVVDNSTIEYNATASPADGGGAIRVKDLGITTAKIAANAVTLAKMAQVATARFLGRVTASTGDVEALTGTQATTLLDAVVGDSGSGGTKGLAPAPAAGDAAANKYLKSSGAWATIAVAEVTGAAPLTSPTFTGTPAAPTAAPATNTTQIATTAFVRAEVAALVDGSPGALDTLNELAAALADDAAFATTVTNALALKAPLASPTFTGNPTAPTPTPGDNDTSIATTAFVQAALTALGLGSGVWTPTLDNTTNVASSTAFQCIYSRVGTTVHFSGKVEVTPSAGEVSTVLGLSLPVASDFAATVDASGVAVLTTEDKQVAVIEASVADNRLTMTFVPVDSSSRTFWFSGSYRIL